MNKSFNFNINNSFGGKKVKLPKKLSPQQEYWLNRILRDHSTQIFVISLLFLLAILASFFISNPNSASEINLININP